MKETRSMAYHNALYFLKWFVMLFAAADLIFGFTHEFSAGLAADQVIAAVKIILLGISIFFHEKKAGIVFLCAYLLIEICYFYLIVLVSGNVRGMFTEQVWSYTIGTLMILVPTLVYYKKRLDLLK